MTWPGIDLWRPYVGLVAWLPRDHYNPDDPHSGRPTVVLKVLAAERVCIVVTRTTSIQAVRPTDVMHEPDPELGCDHKGWWQAFRVYRVPFSAYDDEDVIIYKKLDDELLIRITRIYEGQS